MNGECICCGHSSWRQGARLPAFLFGRAATIEVCRQCGLGRTQPPPALEAEHYQSNDRYDELFIANEAKYRQFARSLLSLLDGRISGGRLLDVGCGGGFLVREALARGFDAHGIEANQSMVEWAQEQGLPVSAGDLQDELSHEEHYDVIVFSAVLEHLERPDEILIACRGLLSPNGILLISQASFDGLLPRVFPWGWYGWQPVEHFWHFTPSSMQRLAGSCGFCMPVVRRMSLYHPFFFKGGLKVIVGRNLASILGRMGHAIGRGDSFDCLLSNQ